MEERKSIRVPPIAFSPWTGWVNRIALCGKGTQPCMGVYLWAYFERPPSPDACPYPNLPAELIYVGQTNNLNVRPLSSARHHALVRYHETFKDPAHRHLYVSVCPVEPFLRGDARSYSLWAYTRYVEARISWRYVQKFGRRPALDYKRNKARPY